MVACHIGVALRWMQALQAALVDVCALSSHWLYPVVASSALARCLWQASAFVRMSASAANTGGAAGAAWGGDAYWG
eukprot:16678-Heterococcus_DN1.PRE.2